MVGLLDGWNGEMEKDSVAASVFSYSFLNMHKSLFHAYDVFQEKDDILAFTEFYYYQEFILSLLKNVAEEGENSRFDKVCAIAHSEYSD